MSLLSENKNPLTQEETKLGKKKPMLLSVLAHT